jgi:putative membrane protein
MSERSEPEQPGGGQFDEDADAMRRTYLANERTYLAWWRTGLTSLAAGIGVGRIVPSLIHQPRWPYAVVGVGFSLIGITTIAYAFWRQRELRDAVSKGEFRHPREDLLLALTVAGVSLGLLLLLVTVIEV